MAQSRISLLICALVLGVLCHLETTANAALIDLRLELSYDNASPTEAGQWRLLARTSDRGLYSLSVPLLGTTGAVVNEAPRGLVNGGADNAGFSPTVIDQQTSFGRELTFVQTPAFNGSQQGFFYGVGTIAQGAPNYPGQPSGTFSIGPNITSLSSVQGVPWGSDTSSFLTGVTLASGAFAPGATPRFGSVDRLQGSVFTSLGTISSPGARTLDIDFSTSVTTNLPFGVATGDYNADGIVNAADYTVWRDTFGQAVAPLTGADGSGNGQIDAADRGVWASNYGAAGAAAVAVPEPTAGSLLAIGAVIAGISGVKTHKSRRSAVKTEQSGGIA